MAIEALARLGGFFIRNYVISKNCLLIECDNTTDRLFCGSCFAKLDGGIRRRLQIGATKTKRYPNDRRAARKYALVISDAVEVLGRHHASSKESDGETASGQETDAA